MNKKLKVYIRTFGCQMNMYDSEVAEGLLENAGFEIIREHRDKIDKGHKDLTLGANIVLMNTCSVREHAEARVFGRLGMLGESKKNNPDLVIGLMGCMVESYRETLFKRFPQLDFIVGTHNVRNLPSLVQSVLENRKQIAQINQNGSSIEYTDQIKRRGLFHAWLPVMTGCDKKCTFCIVPFTRGREVSMPAEEVCFEAKRLVSDGVKWITLLGQNVNSYEGQAARGKEQGRTPISFPKLLEMLCQIDGLERISFTTSHPYDATEELFQAIERNAKILRRFHLPLQSGSDRMLKRMKRLHSYEEYRMKIDRLREVVHDVVITTDIMTGFSGETEEDHQATIRAIKEIQFDSAFIYKYSVRPGTPAARLSDDVPFSLKEERNKELLDLQKKITGEIQRRWIGRTVEVFVEDVSSKHSDELIGRTLEEKKIVFPAPKKLLGCFANVRIEGIRASTLRGKVV